MSGMGDMRNAFDWLTFNTMARLTMMKNAVVIGHILVAVALMLNALTYFTGNHAVVNKWGMMAAVIAWVAAWFHDGEQMDKVPAAVWRIASSAAVMVSYFFWYMGG